MAKSFNAKEIQDVLDLTEGDGFKLKVYGGGPDKDQTKWLSITREQLAAIQTILEED